MPVGSKGQLRAVDRLVGVRGRRLRHSGKDIARSGVDGLEPLWISSTQNRSCDVLYAKGPGLVNRHDHPHQVFGYTISGRWDYLEHEWVATPGDFIYESPGEGTRSSPTTTTSR